MKITAKYHLTKMYSKGDPICIDADSFRDYMNGDSKTIDHIIIYEGKPAVVVAKPRQGYNTQQYILYTPEGDIKVEETATIFKMECGHQSLIEFYEIDEEDDFLTYGIEACFDDANNFDFYAFVVVINPAVKADCAFLPKVINENNITIYLPDGLYEQDLIIYGNNFTLKGVTNDPSLSQCSTILACNIEIQGNNTTFENINFVGDNISDYGNNTQFNNCCFGDE